MPRERTFANRYTACFGIPGYTLKGLEKELIKHHMTTLKAEVFLIRIRQGLEDWRRATPEEKEEAVRRWRALVI